MMLSHTPHCYYLIVIKTGMGYYPDHFQVTIPVAVSPSSIAIEPSPSSISKTCSYNLKLRTLLTTLFAPLLPAPGNPTILPVFTDSILSQTP